MENILDKMEPEQAFISLIIAALDETCDIELDDVSTDAHNKIWVKTSDGRKYVIRVSKDLVL